MKKGLILMLYVVALTVVLKRYYKTESGLPKPSTIAGPTYLYGILALSADFLDNFPVIIASALTVALIWNTQTKPTTVATKSVNPQTKTATG